jgi:hypothetical protein
MKLRALFISGAAAAAIAGSLAFSGATVAVAGTPTTKASKAAPKGGDAGGQRGQRGQRGLGNNLAPAAAALGVSEATLQAELAAGKSIADVAKAKGVNVDTVIDAILQAQRPRIVELVNAKGGRPAGGPGGPGGPGGGGEGDAGGQSATGDALKACLKSKGVDPEKVPSDAAGKKKRADALKACIKST